MWQRSPLKVGPSSWHMGDARREHDSQFLRLRKRSCFVVCRLIGFSVDKADASPLPATHARPTPVESKNAPLMKKVWISTARAYKSRLPKCLFQAAFPSIERATLGTCMTVYANWSKRQQVSSQTLIILHLTAKW